MHQGGYAKCTQRINDAEFNGGARPRLNSADVLRALHTLPQQGSKTPWRIHQPREGSVDASLRSCGRRDDGVQAAPRQAQRRYEEAGLLIAVI